MSIARAARAYICNNNVLSGEVECGHFSPDMKPHPCQRARLEMSDKLVTIAVGRVKNITSLVAYSKLLRLF